MRQPVRSFSEGELLCRESLFPRFQNDPGAQSLLRLLNRWRAHRGGSTQPIAETLRAIHNGIRNPVDLELACKRLEDADFEDILRVMRFAHALFQEHRMEICEVFTHPADFTDTLFD